MENQGYFIIDGSHLFASIYELWRAKPKFQNKKLNIGHLTSALQRKWIPYMDASIRCVYYFKQRDKRLNTMLIIPEADIPGEKDHWRIKECGESIKSIPEEELQKISKQYRDHFMRAEKGLDIKLACDVLTLVSSGRVRNIIFLVNDRDYIPLFEAVQDLGGNTYLTALDSSQKIQKGLANLSDKFLTLDNELDNIFGITE
ncbi:MAG: NYN domain-containing protein [Candidatus Parcubacteria bacterium]|nr:NYN domain-containing protein [Candidatus Parcubacteria bacterium]